MARFNKLKALFGRGARSEQDSARLDTFLKELADPGLISSLQEEEHRRRRWLLAIAALALGLLLGVGGAWWFLARAGTTAARTPASRPGCWRAWERPLARAKEIPQAWIALDEATALAPHLAEAWAALGLADLYGGQMDDAERAFRRCREIDPGNPRGIQGLGDVHFATGETRKAEEVWLKGGAMRSVARLRLLAGRFAEAAPLIQQLQRKTPGPGLHSCHGRSVERRPPDPRAAPAARAGDRRQPEGCHGAGVASLLPAPLPGRRKRSSAASSPAIRTTSRPASGGDGAG